MSYVQYVRFENGHEWVDSVVKYGHRYCRLCGRTWKRGVKQRKCPKPRPAAGGEVG